MSVNNNSHQTWSQGFTPVTPRANAPKLTGSGDEMRAGPTINATRPSSALKFSSVGVDRDHAKITENNQKLENLVIRFLFPFGEAKKLGLMLSKGIRNAFSSGALTNHSDAAALHEDDLRPKSKARQPADLSHLLEGLEPHDPFSKYDIVEDIEKSRTSDLDALLEGEPEAADASNTDMMKEMRMQQLAKDMEDHNL